MVGARGPRTRFVAVVLALLSAMGGLAGCAGQNKFTYVSDAPAKTVFKVPSTWTEVDPRPIDVNFLENTFGMKAQDSEFATQFFQLKWSAAYDAATINPSADKFLETGQTEQPMAYSLVTPLTESFRDAVNFDALRNIFLPVTAAYRQAIVANGGPQYDIEILSDEILTPSTMHGIRTVFNYLIPGTAASLTFDLTALLSQDGSVLHILILRCGARCYRARAVEFDDIATSFTVGSKV